MGNFTMLPNRLVWSSKNEETLLHTYGEKIVHILPFLDGATNRFGKACFTIEDMILSCGMIPKTGAGKVNSQFKDILIDLQSKGIIETTMNLEAVKMKEGIKCTFNMPITKDENDNNVEFFMLDYEAYLEIIDRYEGERSKIALLKIFCYISSRIRNRNSIREGSKIDTSNITVNGGKAECFYDSYYKVSQDLMIAEDTWGTHIKELKDMGLLFYENIGKVEKNGHITNANNVYCIKEDELPQALKQSKDYYRNDGCKLYDKKVSNELNPKSKNENISKNIVFQSPVHKFGGRPVF